MRYEGDNNFASRKAATKFQTLQKAGFVIQGVYDKNGDKAPISFTDSRTGEKKVFETTAQVHQIDGKAYTAYTPSGRDMALIRRAVTMG